VHTCNCRRAKNISAAKPVGPVSVRGAKSSAAPEDGAQQDRFSAGWGFSPRAIACNAQKEASRKSTLEGPARTQPADQATCAAPFCNGIREIGRETLSTNWPKIETSNAFGRSIYPG